MNLLGANLRFHTKAAPCRSSTARDDTYAFLTVDQAGTVPVLELEDGSAIAESNAILG
jgi:glutathione S-transferase